MADLAVPTMPPWEPNLANLGLARRLGQVTKQMTPHYCSLARNLATLPNTPLEINRGNARRLLVLVEDYYDNTN